MFFTYTETLISAVSSHGMNYKITSYLFFPPSIFLKQRKTTLIFLRLLFLAKKDNSNKKVHNGCKSSREIIRNQIKVQQHCFYCWSTFVSHSRVFLIVFKYLLKRQFSLFLTFITENSTRNHYCIDNSFLFYTKWSHSVICKIFYLLILF